jgi:RimJ/RimL family protein N-acetyltransferase
MEKPMLQPTLKPLTLETSLIKLVPMTIQHLDGYCSAGNYPQVWQHMPLNRSASYEIARPWMQEAIDEMAQGLQLAFVIINKGIDKKTDKIIGSTRLFRYNEKDKAIELGHTFITPKYQRSHVNSHAKYLMLKHAFEQLKMARVEICTHENNQQSRNAITRIGGKFEGVLRKNRRAPNGDYRNTALFSIIDDEWPQVKQQLLASGINQKEFEHVSA